MKSLIFRGSYERNTVVIVTKLEKYISNQVVAVVAAAALIAVLLHNLVQEDCDEIFPDFHLQK